VALRTARHGIRSHARLKAAHGDDLLQPDLEGEGEGSPAEDSVGTVVERVKIKSKSKYV
jgi:hypothetical protein